MTDPGPYGGITIQDICDCRCHRVGNPEDMFCRCRDCGEDLADVEEHHAELEYESLKATP